MWKSLVCSDVLSLHLWKNTKKSGLVVKNIEHYFEFLHWLTYSQQVTEVPSFSYVQKYHQDIGLLHSLCGNWV